ncbi:MAG: N-acetylmuramoyl-L-alanine amidase [Chloroflexi bacterium]|nr:N-acetylmuramoyl-L-alanine amidase [Chloroflexota bacterium]
MADRSHSHPNRRTFLKGAVAAGALLGSSDAVRLRAASPAEMSAAQAPVSLSSAVTNGVRHRDWHTVPRNDGTTVEAYSADADGDLQLLRNPDGSFQPTRTFVSSVQQVAGRFNMVAMHWVADVPASTTIAVEVRGSQDGLNWSKWAIVGHEIEARDRRETVSTYETFTDVVDLSRASVMQYRITLTTADTRISPTVQRVTATQIDALDAPLLEDLDSRGRAIPFRVGNGGPPTARLILRDGPNGWGPGYIAPDDPRYWPPFSGVYPNEFVTIHHTAGANNPENPVATMRAVWYYHAIYLGWGDIGYQFLIDQYGNVYQGRDGGDSTEGGHVYRYNHYNCGVCLIGQFQPGATDVPYEGGEPTAEALDSAMRMAALQAAYHGFSPLEQHAYPKPADACRPKLVNYRVCGHRDWGRSGSCVATACPGDNVYKHLPAIRQQAAALIPQIKDFHLMQILDRK